MATERRISRARYTFYVIVLIGAIILMYLFFARDMRFFLVPTSSMLPTFQPRDYIMTLNANNYSRGDLVVLADPTEAGEYVVKRIVGVEGDRITVQGGALLLNGGYVSEPYILEPEIQYTYGPFDVPEGEVFVLGDNRNQSDDSSTWPSGSVDKDSVVGKVRYIYMPFDRMGAVESYPLAVPDDAGSLAN